MQQLHLVGFTTDLEGLIFAARRGAKSGGFVVAIDDDLLEAIDDAFERRAVDDGDDSGENRPMAALSHRRAPRVESTLTPREIQARLRAGRSIGEVARAAGVDEDWVGRFAAPIQAEQAQVITRVRSLVFSKQRLGQSAQPLGTSVLWNLRDKGVAVYDDTFDEGWSAFHVRESEWIVRFGYINRKKAQHAEWLVDLVDGELTARNRLGSELAYVEPGRRRRPVLSAESPAPPPPPADGRSGRTGRGGATAPKRSRPPAAVKKAATRKAATRKAAAKKTVAKKATPKRSGVKKTAAKKAAPRKAAAKKQAAKKSASNKATAKKATTKKAAPRKAAAKRAPAKRAPAKRGTTARAGSRSPAPAARASATAPTPSPSLSRRERRAQRIPPSTTQPPRVALNPVVATPASRTFVPTPSERPARRPLRPEISDRVPQTPPRPAPEPAVADAPAPPAEIEPERPVPVIVIDDADSSVRRISSRNQPGADGDAGRAVTIRAPMAASTLPPPAPVSSRRFGRRRGRGDGAGDAPDGSA